MSPLDATAFHEASARAAAGSAATVAVAGTASKLAGGRRAAAADLPEFDALRDAAAAVKDHTLAHLDLYLERFEEAVLSRGGQVHWASTAAEASAIVASICEAARPDGADAARPRVVKAKSMATEEIGLNAALESAGCSVRETDLGEYIIQLRRERPSHILAPAAHVSRDAVEATFREAHAHRGARDLADAQSLVREARAELRAQYFDTDVGVTGANMLIAETGEAAIVTNEGNADLTHTLTRTHIVVAGVEKLVPTREDAATILRVLARSATGQATSVYTSFVGGPRRPSETDGPTAFHVVLLDNGRTEMLGGGFAEMLRCIRCGACMNICPVYRAIGGHAYGSVYPGPMGAVLTPAVETPAAAGTLPSASTFCGACEAVCPVRIPLPKLMRRWRMRAFAAGAAPRAARWGLAVWAFFARRPRLYGFATRLAVGGLRRLAGRRGALSRVPFGAGWTAHRDFPAPQGETFQAQWARRRRAVDQARTRP